jgi:hypothetical protein
MKKNTLFACFLAILSFSACKETEITPENNKEFPISIEVKQTPNGLEISWPEAKLTGFKTYKLTRQIDSLNFNIFSQSTDTTWVIDDFAQTKILDRNLPVAGKIFYQLSVTTKDRTFKSKMVAYKRKDIISFENLTYDFKVINPTKNLIYLLNNTEDRIKSIDLETSVVSNEVIIPSKSLNIFSFSQADPNYFYFVSADEILIYDAVSLTLKGSLKNSNPSLYQFNSVTSYNGKFYVSLYSYECLVRVFDEKGAELETYKTNINFSYENIIKSMPSQKRLVVFRTSSSNYDAVTLDLKDDGRILSSKKVSNTTDYPFGANMWAVAPNGKNMVTRNKYAMDKDLKILKNNLSISSSGNQEAYYSPDSKYIVIDDQLATSSILETDNFQLIKNLQFGNNGFSGGDVTFLSNSEVINVSEKTIFTSATKTNA